jgi:hypothetical protein
MVRCVWSSLRRVDGPCLGIGVDARIEPVRRAECSRGRFAVVMVIEMTVGGVDPNLKQGVSMRNLASGAIV